MSEVAVVEEQVSVISAKPLNEFEAKEVTVRIVGGISGVLERIEEVEQAIGEAYVGRIWEPLGYTDWAEYCTKELDGALVRLPADARDMLITNLKLRFEMSTRAIAAPLGVNPSTVSRTVAKAPVKKPTKTKGLDGRTTTPKPANKKKTAPIKEDKPEDIDRLNEVIFTARSEGYDPATIAKALEPKITLMEVKNRLKESGATFDAPLDGLTPLRTLDWTDPAVLDDPLAAVVDPHAIRREWVRNGVRNATAALEGLLENFTSEPTLADDFADEIKQIQFLAASLTDVPAAE